MPQFLDLSVHPKPVGREFILALRKRIVAAKTIAIVGAGALGIQYATDIKEYFPDKRVVLIHTRDRYMPLYSKKLGNLLAETLDEIGVERIMNDRVVSPKGGSDQPHKITLQSGMEILCDLQLNCTGLLYNTSLLTDLSPSSLSPRNQILAKPTLQLISTELDPEIAHRIFVIGDVADIQLATHGPNGEPLPKQEVLKNAVSGWFQAEISGKNVKCLIDAEQQSGEEEVVLEEYAPGPPVIKVTAGLYKYVYQKPSDSPPAKDDSDEGYAEEEEDDDDVDVGTMDTPIDLDAGKMWTLYGADVSNMFI